MREGVSRRTQDSSTLSWLESRVREVLTRKQWAWEDAEYEPERWFSTLHLVSTSVDESSVTFLFADPEGERFGYRWVFRNDEEGWNLLADPEDAVALFAAHLVEDVDTTRPGDPDADGVRWFGYS